jgi:hypothetical protein
VPEDVRFGSMALTNPCFPARKKLGRWILKPTMSAQFPTMMPLVKFNPFDAYRRASVLF